jgi:hypothetical protein
MSDLETLKLDGLHERHPGVTQALAYNFFRFLRLPRIAVTFLSMSVVERMLSAPVSSDTGNMTRAAPKPQKNHR